MTRRRAILVWMVLLSFAIALRLGLAFGFPNIFFPDEVFQTLEPAHRLAYGYGVIPWEWRLGVRSWVFPTFLAGIMRLTEWLGTGSIGYLRGTEIALSLLSLIAVWFGYAWAKRASGTPAAAIAALACTFYFGLVYFAPKALTEVVAAHIMLPGLYLGVYAQKPEERKRLFLAGVLCGLAACLRVHLLPALIFAMAYFCWPRWRQRVPAVAAGAAVPALIFGAADWMTWSYPWRSYLGNFMANVVSGTGKLSTVQPWYWYAAALVILLGPAILLLFHGVRRSPFLAIFCAIIVVSHSFFAHKEIRYLYPILAPAIVLASIGVADLLKEIRGRGRILATPRRIAVAGAAVMLICSALMAAWCADWCKTRWGAAAFDRIGRETEVCGVGMYRVIWWESGGYAHLHRNVPILMVADEAELKSQASSFNALIAPRNASAVPSEFAPSQCWKGVCLFERAGSCTAPREDAELNAYLKRTGL
jgi:GPI mannosyltransferase 3